MVKEIWLTWAFLVLGRLEAAADGFVVLKAYTPLKMEAECCGLWLSGARGMLERPSQPNAVA